MSDDSLLVTDIFKIQRDVNELKVLNLILLLSFLSANLVQPNVSQRALVKASIKFLIHATTTHVRN